MQESEELNDWGYEDEHYSTWVLMHENVKD